VMAAAVAGRATTLTTDPSANSRSGPLTFTSLPAERAL
jgi:hypothetical protein